MREYVAMQGLKVLRLILLLPVSHWWITASDARVT